MVRILVGALVACCMLAQSAAAQSDDEEAPRITQNSEAFSASAESAVQALSQAGFDSQLRTPEFGSMTNERFDELVAQIQRESPIATIARGERGIHYDVILQPGHYGRQTGKVGASGALVSERALVAYVVDKVATDLRAKGLNVLVIAADRYLRDDPATAEFDGLRATAFLAIHADGSEQPCSTGPSLGYRSNSSLMSMHAIGFSLAAALGYDYETFRRDNFTANLAQYYMFERVQADRLTGLLEIGELTCPAKEQILVTNADAIAANVARALDFVVNVSQP